MKLLVVFSAVVGFAVAKPGLLGLPSLQTLQALTLVPGAPVGPDGRVVDTPEVAAAKNQHAAAQLNERVNLANEAVRSGELELALASQPQTLEQILVSQNGLARVLTAQDLAAGSRLTLGSPLTLASLVAGTPEAPVGNDGRVVDTPAVALAKVEHATAHLNQQLNLANEATRNSGLIAISGSPTIALRL